MDIPRIGGSPSKTQATAAWGPSASSIAGIGVGQEVYDFGRISAQISVADAFVAMAKANADAVGLDVALGVEESFHSVLAAKAIIGATEDALKRALTHRDYAQAGVKSGLRPPIDLDARAGRRGRAAGAADPGDVGTGGLARGAGGGDGIRSSCRSMPRRRRRICRERRPSPRRCARRRGATPRSSRRMARLDAQHAAVSAVTRELLPNLVATASLTGRAGGTDASGNPTPPSPYGDGWLPDVQNWDVGLIFQWNLFDATVLARRRAAKAREDAARANLDLAKMNVGLATERAYLDLDAALRALPGLQTAVDAAKANQAQAEARFKAGLGTILELADAEALLTNTELELAVGRFTVARTRAILGRVMSAIAAREKPMTTEKDDEMKPSLQPTSIDSHPRERAQLGDTAAVGDDAGGAGAGSGRVRVVVLVGVAVVLFGMLGLYLRAASRVNHVAMAQAPKPVATTKSKAATFRPVHTYVGTTAAWDSARVGPQYVSAYVGTVLVRPGAVVKRGEVLATLDCRNASAASREIAAKAKAIEERQAAAEHEAQRTKEMQQGGFASQNELEQLSARSASEKAEAESMRASLVSRSLEVDDCVLRAPFAGEIAERYVDPGAYVRPGNPVVSRRRSRPRARRRRCARVRLQGRRRRHRGRHRRRVERHQAQGGDQPPRARRRRTVRDTNTQKRIQIIVGVSARGNKFLQTVGDNDPSNDLGNLPECPAPNG